MKKNWFNKLLLSYLPIFFMISLSMLLITYLTLSEMSKRSAMKANDFLAQNIMQTIDDTLRVIDESLFLNIVNNQKINTFFEPLPREQRLYTDYQTINIFGELLQGNRFIDSIYLYRLNDEMVLTPTAFIEIENFGDKEYIGRAIGTLKPFEWEGTREYREQPYEAGRGVISLAKFVQLSTRSLVVVNVKTDSLSEMIQRMSPSPINFIELVNDDGHVIASNYLLSSKPGILAEEMVRNPNEGEVMSKVTSEYTGWTVRSGVYKNGIAEWVSSLFYVWIAFGFLIIAIGVFWLIHVTRRNYRPIQTITNRIADYSKQKKQVLQGDKGVDEFNYIARAIEDLMDTSSILQEENNKNRVYRKKQIFLNLLEGGVNESDSGWRDEVELSGMKVSVHTLVVAVIEIDRYMEFADRYNHKDQQLLKFALSGANREIGDNESIQSWSEWLNRRQMAVIYMAENPAVSLDHIVQLCEKLRSWVDQNLPYTITIGIGNGQDDIGKVQESYTSALNTLQYKASLGMNRLIEPEDLISMPQGEMFRQLQNIRAICQSFRSGEEDWQDHYQELYRTVKGQMYSLDDLHSLLNYLVFHLHKEMMDLPLEFQTIWNGDIHNQLKEVLDQKETVDESCEEFQRVLQDAFEQMLQLRQSKNNHQLIQKVKWFISENFADPDMSLTRLSDEFGLKSGYLSRLFKEEFGENFSDYLAKERINAAIPLLVGAADMTVQDIAVAVGFTNTLTFIRTFKKMTGNTPGNYRKELLQ